MVLKAFGLRFDLERHHDAVQLLRSVRQRSRACGLPAINAEGTSDVGVSAWNTLRDDSGPPDCWGTYSSRRRSMCPRPSEISWPSTRGGHRAHHRHAGAGDRRPRRHLQRRRSTHSAAAAVPPCRPPGERLAPDWSRTAPAAAASPQRRLSAGSSSPPCSSAWNPILVRPST